MIESYSDHDVVEYIRAKRPEAEFYLLNFREESQKYELQKTEFLAAPGPIDENVGGGRSSLPGAPTEKQALRSVGYDEKQETYYWLKAVEIAVRGLSDKKRLFLEVRRKVGNEHRWVAITQMRYLEALEHKCLIPDPWISDETIRRWWYSIVRRTVEIYFALKVKKFFN